MVRFDDPVNDIRRTSPARWLLRSWLATLALAGAAQAQIQSGDILLNVYGANARISRFRPDGSHVWNSTGGTGIDWEGCAITTQGHVITTRRSPHGVNVFDSNGVQIATFATPQVSFLPGDVGVFADGTLAVNDQGGGVDLYTEAGTFVTSFAPAGSLHPFGSFIDSGDNLWLCDIAVPTKIQKVSRAGVLLATFPLTFEPGDLVVAPDGTLWVTSRYDGKLVHFSAGGTQLGFFATAVVGVFDGVALAGDGTFFVTGESSTDLYHYSSAGSLLGTIPIGPPAGTPLFLNISGCGPDPILYCTAKTNSLGCVPAIGSTGSPSASAASGFVVRGVNVRNNKNGLLLYGTTGSSALPFQGGTLCVKTPLKRTGATNSGGAPFPANDCSGVYAIDMNVFAHSAGPPLPLPALTVPGTKVNCQWWGRDQGFAAPNNTTLTDGLEFVVCP